MKPTLLNSCCSECAGHVSVPSLSPWRCIAERFHFGMSLPAALKPFHFQFTNALPYWRYQNLVDA